MHGPIIRIGNDKFGLRDTRRHVVGDQILAFKSRCRSHGAGRSSIPSSVSSGRSGDCSPVDQPGAAQLIREWGKGIKSAGGPCAVSPIARP